MHTSFLSLIWFPPQEFFQEPKSHFRNLIDYLTPEQKPEFYSWKGVGGGDFQSYSTIWQPVLKKHIGS